MKKIIISTALSSCLVATLPSEAAPETGWYLNATFGESRFDDQARRYAEALKGATNLTFGPIQDDVTGSAWGLAVGYQLDATWGIEVGYADLGTTSANARGSDIMVPAIVPPMWVPVDVEVNLNSEVFNVDAVVGSDLGNSDLRVYGKLGIYYFATDAQVLARSHNAVFQTNDSDSVRNIHLGLGLGYQVTRNWTLASEFERYVGVETLGEKDDIDTLMLAAKYRF